MIPLERCLYIQALHHLHDHCAVQPCQLSALRAGQFLAVFFCHEDWLRRESLHAQGVISADLCTVVLQLLWMTPFPKSDFKTSGA